MYPYCFFNGKITDSKKPLIRVNDIAILRGYAAFDFMRIYNGKPFQFKEHMNRFRNTARIMGLKLTYTNQQILEALETLIRKNKDKNYQVRFVLTGGETVRGLMPSVPVFYILLEKFADLPTKDYKKGAKLITHEYQRLFPEAKNSNYMQAVALQRRRLKEKAVEVLYLWNRKVLEATTSNIFIIKDGKVITPDKNILRGITRSLVLRLAQKTGLTVEEREVAHEELLSADEVFLSATNKKVLPIVQIDSNTIADGKVGPISKQLIAEYSKLIS